MTQVTLSFVAYLILFYVSYLFGKRNGARDERERALEKTKAIEKLKANWLEYVAGPSPFAPCDRAPSGWRCNGHYGHEGPCAATPTTMTEDRIQLLEKEIEWRKAERDKILAECAKLQRENKALLDRIFELKKFEKPELYTAFGFMHSPVVLELQRELREEKQAHAQTKASLSDATEARLSLVHRLQQLKELNHRLRQMSVDAPAHPKPTMSEQLPEIKTSWADTKIAYLNSEVALEKHAHAQTREENRRLTQSQSDLRRRNDELQKENAALLARNRKLNPFDRDADEIAIV